MIELPEASVISKELNDALSGKTISNVVVAQSPHKFAWYYEDGKDYHELMVDKSIKGAYNHGGFVKVEIEEDIILLLSEGIRIRYLKDGEQIPKKHQLLIEFTDKSWLVCTIQMYGGLVAFRDGDYDNDYYGAARKKPSPLGDDFNADYFHKLLTGVSEKLSLKAFLATEQRIPGLGNGVLQDILFNAKLHPKKKINSLEEKDIGTLFESVKSTLSEMTEKGGRDTEQDIFGYSGGYQTILSKNTVNKPCLDCGSLIQKQAYMGGSIYFCPVCQKL
jgi:formamidopyrimidine-DNA glycosylase